MMKQSNKPRNGNKQEESTLTKEDFLKVLKKVSRRLPKPSRGKGKKGTLG